MGSARRTDFTVGISAAMNTQVEQLAKATRRSKSDLVDEAWEYYWPVWGDHYLQQAKHTAERKKARPLRAS